MLNCSFKGLSSFGDTEDPDSFYQQYIVPAELKLVAEAQRQAGLTTKQKQAEAQQIADILARSAAMKKTTVPGYTVADAVLSPIDKTFQQMTLARDWIALFTFLPSKLWGQYGMLGKYSFRDIGGKRSYIPFSEADIRRFVFSPYYTVQPGHICTDEQREMGVAALWLATQRHSAKFPAADWQSIWPIYPGWGYPGQRYGCEKYVPTTWVKIRKPVVLAAAIVAAVYLGPIVAGKVAGTSGTSAATGAAATTGASAATGVTATTAATGITATTATTAAAATSGFFQAMQSGANELLTYVNQARTVDAIVRGEIPPPPISVVGDSFTDWAMIVAKEQFMKETQCRMTAKEEATIRVEIQAMQAELGRIIPDSVISEPNSGVPLEVQRKSLELALHEKQAQDSAWMALAIAVPAGFLLLS